MCGVDFLQSLLILACSYNVIDAIRLRKQEEKVKFGEELQDNKQYNCLESQIKFMSLFYLIFSTIDLMILALGNIIETKDNIFECLYDWYLLTGKSSGSFFLFFH